MGVIEAFKMARKKHKMHLVMIGSLASDDPEGQVVLEKMKEETEEDPDIIFFQILTVYMI